MQVQSLIKILNVNLKRNFLPHFAIALVIMIFTPVIFSISSLDYNTSARPVEMLLSLIGAVLMTPVFLPEQNENIRDLIRSKKTDYLTVCFIRIVYSVIAISVIMGIFITVMNFCECDVTIRHFTGGFASALFLGSLGFLSAGLSRNTIIGYMIAFIYYIANFSMKDKLGKVFLFSMSAGSFDEKYWLIIASVIMITITFIYSKISDK